jgi:hypothetical protein
MPNLELMQTANNPELDPELRRMANAEIRRRERRKK